MPPDDDIYGVFDLDPTARGEWRDIPWDNPEDITTEDMMLIQENPNLQLKYLNKVLGEANVLSLGDTAKGEDIKGANVHNWNVFSHSEDRPEKHSVEADEYVPTFTPQQYADYSPEDYVQEYTQNQIKQWLSKEGNTMEDFLAMSGEELLNNFFRADVPLHKNTFGTAEASSYQAVKSYLETLQEGMNKLQDENIGVGALESELAVLKKNVGGKRREQQSMFESLQRTSQDYIAQEKSSRYKGLTGQKTADPTSSYLSDISSYYDKTASADKSIYDIIYGTGDESIHGAKSAWEEEIGGDVGSILQQTNLPSG